MRAWVVWGAVLVVGCGGGTAGPATSAGEQHDGGTPGPAVVQAPSDAGAPDAGERFGYLEPPACEPAPEDAADTRPRHAFACEVRDLNGTGQLVHRLRRNPVSGLVEDERWFGTDGGMSRWVTRAWEGDRELWREDGAANGTRQVQEWRYSDAGVVLRWEQTETWPERAPSRCFEQSTLDGEGRLAWVDRFCDGAYVAQRTYTRDAAGRVVDVTEEDLLDGDGPHWTYAFDAEGRLRRETFTHFVSSALTEYDAEGRPLLEEYCSHHGCSTVRTQYGAHGPVRRDTTSHANGTAVTREEWQYDAEGRPVLRWSWGDYTSDFGRAYDETTRLATRSTYQCGTALLVREELDSTRDGERDGLRTLTYDGAGNLLVEELDGRLVVNGVRRREYDYACGDAPRP